jgi:hypothetical protein
MPWDLCIRRAGAEARSAPPRSGRTMLGPHPAAHLRPHRRSAGAWRRKRDCERNGESDGQEVLGYVGAAGRGVCRRGSQHKVLEGAARARLRAHCRFTRRVGFWPRRGSLAFFSCRSSPDVSQEDAPFSLGGLDAQGLGRVLVVPHLAGAAAPCTHSLRYHALRARAAACGDNGSMWCNLQL